GGVAVTPSFAVGVPSHGYAFRGESVVGRRLREARLGIAIATRLDRVSPRLSIQGSYSYAIVQRGVDIPHNRSNAWFEGAWLVARHLSARGFASLQRTHGGLRAGNGPAPAVGYPWGEVATLDLFTQHDRLLRDNSFHAGAGASYSLPRVDV